MTTSPIYTTRKLEKVVTKLIQPSTPVSLSYLGSWKAHIFYENRKRYWFITNQITKYSFILPGIKASDFSTIQDIFSNGLLEQLVYEGISVNVHQLRSQIGQLQFHSSNNDKSMTSYQNHRLQDLKWSTFDSNVADKRDRLKITKQLNFYPIKLIEYSKPSEEMKKLVEAY